MTVAEPFVRSCNRAGEARLDPLSRHDLTLSARCSCLHACNHSHRQSFGLALLSTCYQCLTHDSEHTLKCEHHE